MLANVGLTFYVKFEKPKLPASNSFRKNITSSAPKAPL